MPVHDNWKELAVDLQIENDELREQLRVLGSNFDKMRADMNAQPQPQIPTVVDEDEYECGKCCARLDEEWLRCPYCESPIYWDGIGEAVWYAEEGERFLQAEVYEPIREAMRR